MTIGHTHETRRLHGKRILCSQVRVILIGRILLQDNLGITSSIKIVVQSPLTYDKRTEGQTSEQVVMPISSKNQSKKTLERCTVWRFCIVAGCCLCERFGTIFFFTTEHFDFPINLAHSSIGQEEFRIPYTVIGSKDEVVVVDTDDDDEPRFHTAIVCSTADWLDDGKGRRLGLA